MLRSMEIAARTPASPLTDEQVARARVRWERDKRHRSTPVAEPTAAKKKVAAKKSAAVETEAAPAAKQPAAKQPAAKKPAVKKKAAEPIPEPIPEPEAPKATRRRRAADVAQAEAAAAEAAVQQAALDAAAAEAAAAERAAAERAAQERAAAEAATARSPAPVRRRPSACAPIAKPVRAERAHRPRRWWRRPRSHRPRRRPRRVRVRSRSSPGRRGRAPCCRCPRVRSPRRPRGAVSPVAVATIVVPARGWAVGSVPRHRRPARVAGRRGSASIRKR